jgi:hypothetical protein
MTEREIIDAVLDLLSDESKWTKGCFARNTDGDSVSPESAEACCWCLDGAIIRCFADSPDDTAAHDAIWWTLLEACNQPSTCADSGIAGFNDYSKTTYEDVRELLLKVREGFDD